MSNMIPRTAPALSAFSFVEEDVSEEVEDTVEASDDLCASDGEDFAALSAILLRLLPMNPSTVTAAVIKSIAFATFLNVIL
mmetsp:Transcript_50417/g.107376  ORF Transcript_50417/g.107376 Transcript_50417/m.107376 type:complete len:81 (-) Transcript_50417:60-302(-)